MFRSLVSRVGSTAALFLKCFACAGSASGDGAGSVKIRTVLPFTGRDSTIGQNIEEAMLLAVEDVNRAGGVNNRPVRLVSRDSSFGTTRGLNALLSVLYEDQARYLVGPEENSLANEIASDVRALDVLSILPGHSAPGVERVSRTGAWMRLASGALPLGCSYAELSQWKGVTSANAIVTDDDFYHLVASEFFGEFESAGFNAYPNVFVTRGSDSVVPRSARALSAGAERTVLLVDPVTAIDVVTQWALGEQAGGLILGPTLRTPGGYYPMCHMARSIQRQGARDAPLSRGDLSSSTTTPPTAIVRTHPNHDTSGTAHQRLP